MLNITVAVGGPTASGKSGTAVSLAKKIDGEIISADVMQSYRELSIGTAKPTASEMEEIPHYMVDEYSIFDDVDTAVYSERALKYINEARNKNRTPIITGGSVLYLDSILYASYDYADNTVDQAYREALMKTAEEKGADYLYGLLCDCDPEYAQNTHPNNVKRIIRALEYYKASGTKKSSNAKTKTFRNPWTYYFAIRVDRDILYKRIDTRVDEMVNRGLIDEVRALICDEKTLKRNAMQAIGYKEIAHALIHNENILEAVAAVKQKSRNYAKRQYTWLNANPDIIWLDAQIYDNHEKRADRMIEVIYDKN
jgi:tRNA dimethylallyltransferase